MRTLCAVIFLSASMSWCSAAHAQGIPSVPQGITLLSRVTFNKATGIYGYDYRVFNPATNASEVGDIYINITRSPNQLELSRVGLVNGPGYLANTSADLSQQIPMVPVGIDGPAGWVYGLAIRIVSGTAQGFASWDVLDSPTAAVPGQTVGGFRLTSYGLPGIRQAQIEPVIDYESLPDEFDAPGKAKELLESLASRVTTIGPSSPPARFVASDFLNYLIDLVHESRRLGWIRNAHESRELLEVLFEAKRRIETGQPAKATKRIERFLKRVREEGCRGFRCSEEKGLSSEAFALLFFNGQFLLDHLPPSRDRDDDRDRSDD